MTPPWLRAIADRFDAARSRRLPAVNVGDLRRVASPRATAAALIVVPVVVLWFAVLAAMSGSPVDYISPGAGLSPGDRGTQPTEQNILDAVGGTQPGGVSATGSPTPTATGQVGHGTGSTPPAAGGAPPLTGATPAGTIAGQSLPAPAQPTPAPPAGVPTANPTASLQPPPPSSSPGASPDPVTPTPNPSTPAPTPIATTAVDQCSDGIDNDGDLLIDLLDPGCLVGLGNDEGAL